MNTVDYLKKILEGWGHSTVDFLPKLLLAVLVLLVFFLLAKLGQKISLRFYSRSIKSNSDVARIIAAAIYFFLLLSGVFIALEILGLEQVLTKLLAGAGIVGIIAGFAFKDIASNAFAGLLLSLQRPFKIGDWIEIDNAYGTVLKISWLTTAIETMPGQEVFVPNQIIYSNTFTNFSTFSKRQIILKCAVLYGSDLEYVKSIALDEVKKHGNLLETESINFFYTNIGYTDTGNTTFAFEVSFWIRFSREDDYRQAMSDAIISIKKRFEMEKIPLA